MPVLRGEAVRLQSPSGVPLMRRILPFLIAFVVLAPVAVAGDGGCPMGGSCANGCPLAQEANGHRSTGGEAVFASKLIRAEYVKTITKAIADL